MSSKKSSLHGSMPAVVTPMKRNGDVDFKKLERLVNWLITEGSTGLVAVGTTGESPTLSHEEHGQVVDVVVRVAAGRVPVIAGAGSNNTTEALELVQSAQRTGADYALVVTPYYNKPTQQGLYAHFAMLSEVGIPIIIYNIPSRSVVDMTPVTMGKLAKLTNIIGVKDATGDLSRVSFTRMTCGKEFIQLSGEDSTAVGFNAQGGCGCISVTANVAPKLCARLQAATLDGDYVTALEIQDLLTKLHIALFTEPGLCGAKYALSLLGMTSDVVRLPLLGVRSDTKRLIRAAMMHAGVLEK